MSVFLVTIIFSVTFDLNVLLISANISLSSQKTRENLEKNCVLTTIPLPRKGYSQFKLSRSLPYILF